MALKPATQSLVITPTTGAADAFISGSVLTGLTGRQAYNVRKFQFEIINPATVVGIGADGELQFAVSRRSKTSMPNLSDSDVLWKGGFIFALTTSGIAVIPSVIEYAVPESLEIPIVEETLYAYIDSTSLGLVVAGVFRLEVVLDTMADIDRLNLIARSLT